MFSIRFEHIARATEFTEDSDFDNNQHSQDITEYYNGASGMTNTYFSSFF